MAAKKERIEIKAPKFNTAVFKIEGTSPLVMNKFSHKALLQMKEKQEAGPQAKKGKKREAKNFNECYEGATYRNGSKSGWIGIPATAFRSAIIGACRLVGFTMTHAKLGAKCFYICCCECVCEHFVLLCVLVLLPIRKFSC